MIKIQRERAVVSDCCCRGERDREKGKEKNRSSAITITITTLHPLSLVSLSPILRLPYFHS